MLAGQARTATRGYSSSSLSPQHVLHAVRATRPASRLRGASYAKAPRGGTTRPHKEETLEDERSTPDNRTERPHPSRSEGLNMGVLVAACVPAVLWPQAVRAQDIPMADFEGGTYGDRHVEGDALGPGPAHGTLPSQMAVTGYEGQGLANSFYRRRRDHRGADVATTQHTAPIYQLPHRQGELARRDVHQPAGGWRGRQDGDGAQRPAGRK